MSTELSPKDTPPIGPPGAAKATPANLSRRWFIEPLANPTGKQKEAYARFFHTLSAGCFIGAVTVAFSGAGIQVAVRAAVLILLGIVLFFVAAGLAKGEVND